MLNKPNLKNAINYNSIFLRGKENCQKINF